MKALFYKQISPSAMVLERTQEIDRSYQTYLQPGRLSKNLIASVGSMPTVTTYETIAYTRVGEMPDGAVLFIRKAYED